MQRVGEALWQRGDLGMALVTAQGRLKEANAKLLQWLDLSAEQIHGVDLSRLFQGDSHKDSLGEKTDIRPARGATDLCLEMSALDLDGGDRLLTFKDVTAERLLLHEVKQKRAALEDALYGYDIVDEHGKIVYANRAYLDMWGYQSLDEVLGKSPAEHCVDPEIPKRIINDLTTCGRTTVEFKGRRKDGSVFDVLMSAQISKDAEGRPCFLGTSLDVSELKRLQTELNHLQKMELLGTLAASVAHDFNNLLSPILGFGELMMADGVAPEHRRYLESMMSAAEHSRELTGQLLAMSRKQMLKPEPTELVQATCELEGLLRRVLREDISLQILPAVESCWVMVDPSQLQQILMNLVVNARDAMPTGGTVTVEIAERELDSEFCDYRLAATPGAFGELVVTDTGEGMSEETLERVFEPFFTTKGQFGTGLGLATVHGIVKQHGGNIWVYSEPGCGTTFKVYLPVTKSARRRAEPVADNSATITDRKILLVEDNPHVRNVVEQVLIRAGYQVHAFETGTAALAWLEQSGVAPHLLLTDMVLCDTDGARLANSVRDRLPETRVLYMSGYTDSVMARRGVLTSEADLLQKPISAKELLRRVRSALSS